MPGAQSCKCACELLLLYNKVMVTICQSIYLKVSTDSSGTDTGQDIACNYPLGVGVLRRDRRGFAVALGVCRILYEIRPKK